MDEFRENWRFTQWDLAGGGAGAKVDMVAGMLVLGMDEVSGGVVITLTFALRAGMRCYKAAVEEN